MAFAETLRGRARKAMRMALSEMGRRAVRHIRQTLSEPVVKVGSEWIRSDPGDYPTRDVPGSVRHHEPGMLRKSIKYQVLPQAESLEELLIFTDCSYAPMVNYGHAEAAPRPFWEPAMEFIDGEIQNDLKEVFAQKLAEVNEGFDEAATADDVSDE